MSFNRDIEKEIEKELFTPEIIILLGSRQVGKTTILNIIKNNLTQKKEKCLFLDLDLETNLEYFSSYQNIIDYIRLNGFDPQKDKLFLFIDEFQRIKNAAQTLKNLFDHNQNIKIIATGSSSIEINKTISESMSGRKTIFRVYPLNFREYLLFQKENVLLKIYDEFKIGANFSEVLQQKFSEFLNDKLIFGSYPAVVLEKEINKKGLKINDILNSYLRKDIRELLNIQELVLYQNVLELLANMNANLINVSNISQGLGGNYRKITNAINIAAETYIIDILRPHFKNKKTEIVKNPKVYFEDLGMRNFLIKNMSTTFKIRNDLGQLIENFVYNELKNKIDVFTQLKYWRTKNLTEIDFLLIKNQNILPIEVKGGSEQNIPLALLNFCKKENLKKAVILNKNISLIKKLDNIEFVFLPYFFTQKILALLN